ncbi:MAG: penicillin-binding protein [Pyrinomonadaceae bacterium]|nr:penicillin-binding protein [Pyrinomonadaceae bacterium]
MKIPSIKNILGKKSVRFSLIGLAIFWSLFLALFYSAFQSAFAHLQANNPQNLQNRSELQVFYAPLELHTGEEFPLAELTAYFDELAYENRPDSTPGSYFVGKTSVTFVPRSKVFQAGLISFNKNRVFKISVNAKNVEKIELEALPMRSFIKYVNRESLKTELIRRVVLSPDAIPEKLADAVTSAEDTRFYEHHGIDVFGIGYRVLTLRGGGSSITQQLIKGNVLKNSSEEFWQKYFSFLPEKLLRKIMEIPFALAAEEMLTKNQILAAYLSMIPLGASEGVELHGVISAAQEYFGKSISELSLSESAAIAGIIHKPSFYVGLGRKNDYQKLIGRRNRILDAIYRNHPEKYSSEEIEKAKNEPLKFVFASANRSERPADAYSRLFAAYTANHLPENLAAIRQTEGNLQIFTTLDYRLQKLATEISEKAITDLTKKVYAECLRQKPENIDCKQVIPQVSLVAMEAETGEILAMYGGNSPDFNFATAKRSPASAIKPFYYLLALEKGIWNGKPFTPETVIDPETDSVGFRPNNNVGVKSAAKIGLAKSYNFHAVAAAESVGIENAIGFVGKLTNSTPEKNGMSAIGGSKGSETRLLEMVSAYSVFSNQGVLVKAVPNRFYLLNDEKFVLPKAKPERIASVESAIKTNEMMKLVLNEIGTAPNFKKEANLPQTAEISGKTGSGMVADCWFFAVTPKLIVGVWIGLPKNEIKLEMEKGFTGGKIAAPVAAGFFKGLAKTDPNLIGLK